MALLPLTKDDVLDLALLLIADSLDVFRVGRWLSPVLGCLVVGRMVLIVVGIFVGPNGVGLGAGIVGVMTFGAIVGSPPSLPNWQNSSLAGSNFF